MTMTVTYYSNNCRKRSDPDYGITATGKRTGLGTISADPHVLPAGTVLFVPGYGYGVVTDTGVTGNHLDCWLPTDKECFERGKREVVVRILS
jgi:3D (Asp-Asp-Asp) domain-containing protein